MWWRGLAAGLLVVLISSFAVARQSRSAEHPIRSHMTGRITVNAEIDSTRNFEGFEVIVVTAQGGVLDTLGYGVTDRSGAFSLDTVAPQRGVYAMLVKRLGEILNNSEVVLADGDSTVVTLELPLGGRVPRVRSRENAAWVAFRNTDAQYNEQLMELLRQGTTDDASLGMVIRRSADLLWGLQGTFPGTLGAAAAAVKSVTILEAWDDSLVVERSAQLSPDAPGFVEAVRAAHRATARRQGLQEAIGLVERAMTRTQRPEHLAALEATIVQAHLDSLQSNEAAISARSLRQSYEGSLWAIWAERAEYEAKNLMPGMEAPDFETITRGDSLFRLTDLRGKQVVLEFWDPQDATFREELDRINALASDVAGSTVWVSIALNTDLDLIEAFLEGRSLPGVLLQDTRGYESEVARLYNINSLPTRYLIDASGRIVRKYAGDGLMRLTEDLQRRAADR